MKYELPTLPQIDFRYGTCSSPCRERREKEQKGDHPAATSQDANGKTKAKQCEACGKEFTHKSASAKYCGYWCREKSKNKARNTSNGYKCKNCGEIKHRSEYKPPKGRSEFKITPTSCNKCRQEKERASARKQKKNPKNKPRQRLSKRFQESMKQVQRGGNHRLKDFIGCSTAFLRKHLESQFVKGMKWRNYGTKWHIDHIQPISSFDHTDEEQVRRCWHFSNLRPLFAVDNIAKSDAIVTCQPELLLCL